MPLCPADPDPSPRWSPLSPAPIYLRAIVVADASAQPAASVYGPGQLLMVTQAGQATIVKLSCINSAGGVEWVALGQSS